MPRKRSILRKNLILSIGFGLGMGIVFPLYSLVFVSFKSPLMAIYFSIGCLVAGFLVGIFGYIINTRPIVRITRRISNAIELIKCGTVDMEELDIDSDDAIGRLAENFVTSIQLFQQSLADLQSTFDSAMGVSQEINLNIETTLQSTSVLFGTIELLSQATVELDDHNDAIRNGFETLSKATLLNVSSIVELYSHINEFGTTILHQSESLNQVAQTLIRVEELVGDSRNDRDDTLSGLEARMGSRVHDTIDTSLAIFGGVKQRLQEIDGIAERTNILSINAAIEAARLGTQGAGFRVIASNIKTLAEEVRSLTASISAEMLGGEQNLSAVTGYLNETVGTQAEIISNIRNSIQALSQRNSILAEQMTTVEENRLNIDTLLGDIKKNMQGLKKQVIDSRDRLGVLLNTSQVIRSGINTLADKSTLIVDNGKSVTSSLTDFKNRLTKITMDKK